MVTKTSWDAVVRMLLAAMHSFFEKFRGDIAAFLAFHENESRRQLVRHGGHDVFRLSRVGAPSWWKEVLIPPGAQLRPVVHLVKARGWTVAVDIQEAPPNPSPPPPDSDDEMEVQAEEDDSEVEVEVEDED